jgi:hypothetical protein
MSLIGLAIAIFTHRRHLCPDFYTEWKTSKKLKAVGYGLKGCNWFAAAIQPQCDPERAMTRAMKRADSIATVSSSSSSSSMDNMGSDSTLQPVNRSPPALGTRRNLPKFIRRWFGATWFGATSKVIAWTTLDHQWD